jgi:hypothetical protein
MGYTINDTDSRHNGWTNYATWRVNLEMFDGFDAREYFTDANDEFDASELADNLKAYADDMLTINGEKGLAVDYARAFMADVNWQEIAEHLLDAIKSEAA